MSLVVLPYSVMSKSKDEIFVWLEENIGKQYLFNAAKTFFESEDKEWYFFMSPSYSKNTYNDIEYDSGFLFKDKDKAMLFKLTWGGR